MRKFLVCGLLMGAVGLFAGNLPSPAVAQKKDPKGGVVEMSKGKDDKYRFVVRNANNKLLAMSGPTGYASEKEALKVLEELKEVLKTAKVVMKKKDKDGK